MSSPREAPAVRSDARAASPVRARLVPFEGGQTWYRITQSARPPTPGAGSSAPAPVIVAHGGPGLAHNGCLAMAGLAGDGRAVVHYDQIGCGRSSHVPDADPSWWTVDLFVRELRTLARALDMSRFHLVGHSWGGMLAAEYALRHPDDLASLVLCNSPASMPLWMAAADRIINAQPDDVRQAIRRHEAAGTTDSAEYERATSYLYERHFCRVRPIPADIRDSLRQMKDDPTVYHTMNGPSEFTVTGSLRDWSIVDRVHHITTPTLVLAGEYDEATPDTWMPYVHGIPGARSHVFADASHTPHVEQTEQWLAIVSRFIQEHDDVSSP